MNLNQKAIIELGLNSEFKFRGEQSSPVLIIILLFISLGVSTYYGILGLIISFALLYLIATPLFLRSVNVVSGDTLYSFKYGRYKEYKLKDIHTKSFGARRVLYIDTGKRIKKLTILGKESRKYWDEYYNEELINDKN